MFLFLFYFNWRLITLQYCGGFCHIFTWISHGCTCVPHPDTPSHFPSHPLPQGHSSAPDLTTLPHASNLDWRSISHMPIYMFQCYSLKSSHSHLLPQNPKICSLYLWGSRYSWEESTSLTMAAQSGQRNSLKNLRDKWGLELDRKPGPVFQ